MSHQRPGYWLREALVPLCAGAVAAVLVTLLWEGLSLYGWVGGALQGGVMAAVAVAVAVTVALRRRREQARALTEALEARTRDAEASLSLLGLVLDKAPSAFIVVDRDRRVVRANRVAERLHGVAMSRDTCGDVLRDPERCSVCPGCMTLETGLPGVGCRDHTDPRTGEILRIESHPLKLSDGTDCALLIERVVTEQRKLQASLVHQEKMAAFGLVAAGIAHEMGNPLSSIDMHLQLLDGAGLPEEHADSVRTLRQETARLRRTLRELVDFARRRRDEATLVSVQSVVDDALRLVRYDRRFRGVDTRVEIDPETPPVFIVEDHLVQVILNLVINALDAMKGGGVLTIDGRHVGDRVALRVRDTGCGMPRSVLDRCFEPLFTTKEPGKGTGLGLSICRDVLRAAGGDLELHSMPGRGTTAVVTLPATASAGRWEPRREAMTA